MQKKEYSNYWSKTSSYEVISDRIAENFAGTSTNDDYVVTNRIIQSSKELLAETVRKNADAVAKASLM